MKPACELTQSLKWYSPSHTQCRPDGLTQRTQTEPQHAIGADLLVYFLPRGSRFRLYFPPALRGFAFFHKQTLIAGRRGSGCDDQVRVGSSIYFTETMSGSRSARRFVRLARCFLNAVNRALCFMQCRNQCKMLSSRHY